MPPALDGSLEEWLRAQVRLRAELFASKPLIIDVGAYHGDFTAQWLNDKIGAFRSAVLFEPNPANLGPLRKRFGPAASVRIEAIACDEMAGEHEFFWAGPAYTGSLLCYSTVSAGPVNRSVVKCTTLDCYLAEHQRMSEVGLLKIDTQGNDLRVLRGAVQTLNTSRPWIIAELIYLPFYVGQCQPHEISAWLAPQGYVMAAQFNEQYTSTGWLAWADGCFVPAELTAGFADDFVPRPTAEAAEREVRRGFWRRLRKQIKRLFQNGCD